MNPMKPSRSTPPNELHIGIQRRPIGVEEVQRLADHLERIARTLDNYNHVLDASAVLYEVAKFMAGPEPLSLSSGLAPQPAAAIDQVQSVSYAHSAAAMSAVALIKGVATGMRSGVYHAEAYADQLERALELLGVKT